MSAPLTTRQSIAIAVMVVGVRQAKLEQLILDACPGPHAYVQHRDRRPPWCKACRYTRSGHLIPERQAPPA